MDSAEEIKNRLSITDVVRDYVSEIKPAGNGTYKALCPFHNDTNPSLIISEKKGIAWCFSCNSGGDHFGFVQKAENCTFPEALKILADKAGITLPEINPETTKKNTALKEQKEVLTSALEIYQGYLEEQKNADTYRTEQKKRQYPDEIWERFRVGYAPAQYDISPLMHQQGYGQQVLIDAGIMKIQGNARATNSFKERVMFPIWDARGKLVGHSGRYVGQRDGPPKYLNTSQTPLYHKGSLLYGLHLAQEGIRKEKEVIVVEGFYDVMACHAVGVTNVVATCGTALTPDHMRILKRSAQTIVLAMDTDLPGVTAAIKAGGLVMESDLELKTVSLPGGKDADELWRQDPQALKKAMQNPGEGYQNLLNEAIRLTGSSSLEEKRGVLRMMMPLLGRDQSPLQRHHALSLTSQALGLPTEVLEQEVERNTFSTTGRAEKKKERDEGAFSQAAGFLILALGLQSEELYQLFWNEGRKAGTAYGEKIQKLLVDIEPWQQTIQDWVREEGKLPEEPWSEALRIAAAYGESRYTPLGEKEMHLELKHLIRRAQKYALESELVLLQKDLEQGETPEALEAVMRVQKALREVHQG